MRIIPLTKNYVAIISAKHFRRVNRYKWHVHFSKGTKRSHGYPYARATIKGKKIYLHRFLKEKEIMDMCLYGCTSRESFWQVDHKNNQTLDCRDENLRVLTHIENQRNKRKKKKTIDITVCMTQIETSLETNQQKEGI